MDIKEKILNYIIKNKLSTTEVADAMGKTGLVQGVFPLNNEDYKVGSVKVCFAWDDTNYNVHKQFKEIEKDDIIFVCPYKFDDIAVLGDLMVKYALTYQQAKALIVLGKVRDVSKLYKEKFSIWSEGYTPIGCKNTKENFNLSKTFQQEMIERFDGGIAVCDAAGVVVISVRHLDEDMLNRLHLIEIQEDIWNYSLNTLGWDTKKIVCDKAYLQERLIFPKELNKYFNVLKNGFNKR
jgi:regulator of RNase E activity RraA